MRFVTFSSVQGPRLGLLCPGDTVVEARMHGRAAPPGLLEIIQDWPRASTELTAGPEVGPLDSLDLLPPLCRPRRNIFCVGKNYHDHRVEFARSGFDATTTGPDTDGSTREPPAFFTKSVGSVIGPNASIDPHVGITSSVDYEVELAVIVGRPGRDIPYARAGEHVWGYTIVNDVTARDLQRAHRQWFLGKSLDTFCPMGPCAVTADEVDVGSLTLRTWVNGELRQDGNTRDMITDVASLVAQLSRGITLLPGDVIATGTPAGVGIGFSPPRFLHPGDVVTMEISDIGTLTNSLATADSHSGARVGHQELIHDGQ